MKKLIIGITAPNSVDLLIGQLNYLKNNGFDVALLAPSDERVHEYCQKEGVRHLPISIERNISIFKDFKTLWKLILLFKREKPDIINLGTPKISLLGMLAGWITQVPLRIYTCRGFRFEHERGRLFKLLVFLEKITSSCAHKVFCISKSVRDLGINLNIFPLVKTRLIHFGSSNGVDLILFDREKLNKQQLEQIKEDYQLNNCFVFGFVGRLVDRKGLKEMFDAFDSVYKKHRNSRLLVVGRPFWDQIKNPKIIEQFNNHTGVIMLGFQEIEKVPYFLASMDVFLLPAHWEGFGNVLIQAAAMGLPIVATEVTGVKDAVKNNFNGILVQNGNLQALIDAMEDLMLDIDKRSQMSRNSLEWSKNFQPKIIWDGYIDLYKEAL